MYILAKHLHLSLVITSVAFFAWRFYLVTKKSQMVDKKWLKVLPHVIDSLLLLSAIWLCFLIRQYPIADAWLSQKLLAVILYIVFGYYTLKKADSMRQRYVGFGFCVLSLFFAAHTAVTKNVIFFF